MNKMFSILALMSIINYSSASPFSGWSAKASEFKDILVNSALSIKVTASLEKRLTVNNAVYAAGIYYMYTQLAPNVHNRIKSMVSYDNYTQEINRIRNLITSQSMLFNWRNNTWAVAEEVRQNGITIRQQMQQTQSGRGTYIDEFKNHSQLEARNLEDKIQYLRPILPKYRKRAITVYGIELGYCVREYTIDELIVKTAEENGLYIQDQNEPLKGLTSPQIQAISNNIRVNPNYKFRPVETDLIDLYINALICKDRLNALVELAR
jgi:hypothetical protein